MFEGMTLTFKWTINAYDEKYQFMGTIGRKNVYCDVYGCTYIQHKGKLFPVTTNERNEHYVRMNEKYYGYDAKGDK